MQIKGIRGLIGFLKRRDIIGHGTDGDRVICLPAKGRLQRVALQDRRRQRDSGAIARECWRLKHVPSRHAKHRIARRYYREYIFIKQPDAAAD